MSALNFIFSMVSLFIGVVILFFAVVQSGADPTPPTLLGLALTLNGLIRLWFARGDRPAV